MLTIKIRTLVFCLLFTLSPVSLAQTIDDDLLLSIPSLIAAVNNNQVTALEIPRPPGGFCEIPNAAMAEDVSNPDHVIGNGTASSCTSEAVVSAVAQGGVITFNCGASPVPVK